MFVTPQSDEDPNTTASDFDSNPCTPQTPVTANEESPVKLTDDGCFKVPPDKNFDDPRIATRTRSKLCLQQTTIEDLQSEFVPPDVEQSDVLEHDTTALDAEWMKFLNDFTKPLSECIICMCDCIPKYLYNPSQTTPFWAMTTILLTIRSTLPLKACLWMPKNCAM